jgi:hypothetical protein
MVTVGLFPGTKRPGMWSWPLALYRAEDISGAIPALPHVPSWCRWGNFLPLLYLLTCLFVIYCMKSVIQTVLCRRVVWRMGSESERRCKEAGVFSFGGRCRYYCRRTEESHEQGVVGNKTEIWTRHLQSPPTLYSRQQVRSFLSLVYPTYFDPVRDVTKIRTEERLRIQWI